MYKGKQNPLPSQDFLLDLFTYDKVTGILSWKERRPGVNASKIAGVSSGGDNPYIVVRIGDKLYAGHRLIWKFVTGEDPKELIDHKDCDGTNNKWDNLREATNGQNFQNSRISKRNSSGIKGVSWDKQTGRWRVTIMADGKTIRPPRCDTLEDAGAIINKIRAEFHGDFARFE